jgi:hypothetical protein
MHAKDNSFYYNKWTHNKLIFSIFIIILSKTREVPACLYETSSRINKNKFIQNKFTQINKCNEILSYIINRMNLIQLEEIKTEAFYWEEFYISPEPICCMSIHYYVLKCKRCRPTQDVKDWFAGCKQTEDDV